MVVYVECPSCGTEQIIKMVKATSEEDMKLPAFLLTMREMMKDRFIHECTRCRYEIPLMDQTFRFRD